MKSFVKSIGATLIGLLIFISTLFLLFSTLKKPETEQQKVRKIVTYLEPAELIKYLSFLRGPGTVMNVKYFYEGELIYDQNYKTDNFLFRVPMLKNDRASQHAIFGGCSFTWGEGLKEEDTLPWMFQKSAKEFNSYNLGFPGGGLHTLLRYMEIFDLQKAIRNKKGYFFYVFMSNHLDRFYGRYNYLDLKPDNAPYYEVLDDRPIYRGEMKDQTFYKNFHNASDFNLKEALLRSQDSESWTDKELADFSKAVEELKKRYKTALPEGKFYLIFHPTGVSYNVRNKLANQLKKLKIDYLEPFEDYHSYLQEKKLTYDDMKIRSDGHPSAKLNEFFGKWIVEEMEKK